MEKNYYQRNNLKVSSYLNDSNFRENFKSFFIDYITNIRHFIPGTIMTIALPHIGDYVEQLKKNNILFLGKYHNPAWKLVKKIFNKWNIGKEMP